MRKSSFEWSQKSGTLKFNKRAFDDEGKNFVFKKNFFMCFEDEEMMNNGKAKIKNLFANLVSF